MNRTSIAVILLILVSVVVLRRCGEEEKGATKNPPAQAAVVPADPAKIWAVEPAGEKIAGRVADRADLAYTSTPEIAVQIPLSPAIPKIGMGAAIMGQALTPKSAGNLIVVRAGCSGKAIDAANDLVLALFRNGAPDAVRAATAPVPAGGAGRADLLYQFPADGTSPQSFEVRVGVGRAGKLLLNPVASENSCKLSIEEYVKG